MNIVILGAGAIGMVFGGFLANAGHHVTLIGRKEHIAAVNDRGLLIEGIWGNHLVTNLKGFTRIDDINPEKRKRFDLALLTVKSYDTEPMMTSFHQQFRDQIPVVSLQNGVSNLERIISIVGTAQAVGGSVTFGVKTTAPGSVRIAVHAEDVIIGGKEPGIDHHGVQQIAELFSSAGIKTQATSSIYRFLWGKMLYNCALNGLAAILEVPYGELMEHESGRMLISEIIREIYTLLEYEEQRVNWPNADAYLKDLFERLLPLTYEHTPSMLQDLQHSKRTEIDALNGTIVTLAEKHGLDVPVNWLVTKLIKVKEQTVAS